MNEDVEFAIKSAEEISKKIEAYLLMGNMELAHRLGGVYQSLLLTALVLELIPGAKELLDELEVPIPEKDEEGNLVQ
jgi:hypothetical protein